jgi:hypothetical protein
LIDASSEAGRGKYTRRIHDRLRVEVSNYAVLNIHRIGIDAPAERVFEEILDWKVAARCWPGHLATLERAAHSPEHVDVFLLGRRKKLPGIKLDLFGLNVVPLFTMNLVKLQREPGTSALENARYMLYECSGGYPVGAFCVYVRPPIPHEGEIEQTQVFMAVWFNFYGRKDHARVVNKVWELIHNRVTGNVLNRVKQLCETRHREDVGEP